MAVLDFLAKGLSIPTSTNRSSYLTDVIKYVITKASTHFVTCASYLQDLRMHLHLRGMIHAEALKVDRDESAVGKTECRKVLKESSIETLPFVTRLALLVPREMVDKNLLLPDGVSQHKGHMLTGGKLLTPRLIEHVCVGYKDHIFGSLDYSFVRNIGEDVSGEVEAAREAASEAADETPWSVLCDTFSLEEDAEGLFGSGDLAIMFDVPTLLLMVEPERTKICMTVVQVEKSSALCAGFGNGVGNCSCGFEGCRSSWNCRAVDA